MINATSAVVIAVAVLAAQGSSVGPTGNYDGLSKLTRPTARHELKPARQAVPPKAHEVVRRQTDGVERGPCGMPVIAADASVDPRIIVAIPAREEVEVKPQADEATRCGPFTSVPARKVPAPSTKR